MEPTRHEQEPATPTPDCATGTLLDGKYLIVGEIGAGGMGVVYEGRNIAIERRVAIKMLHPCYAGHGEAVARFELEARAAAPIAHPSIVDVLDMGRTEAGIPYIVMEHLEGVGLYERLTKGGPLLLAQAVSVVLQVLGALSAAHAAGVVHRDVKPENVFLVRRGEGDEVVKILDFGVATFSPPRRTMAGRLTAAGIVIGTPGYMSPEQSQGGDVDARSDLYSVGVLLYELLTGKLPLGPEGSSVAIPILRLAPGLPSALGDVLDKALRRAPAERFQTAAELMTALRPFEHLSVAAAALAPGASIAEEDAVAASDRETAAGPAERGPELDPPPPAAPRARARPLVGWLGLVLTASVSIGATLVLRHVVAAPPVDRGARTAVLERSGGAPSPAALRTAPPSAAGGQVAAREAVASPRSARNEPRVDTEVVPTSRAPFAAESPTPRRAGRVKRVLPFSHVY